MDRLVGEKPRIWEARSRVSEDSARLDFRQRPVREREGCLARSDVHGEAEVDVASGVPAADAPVFESDLVKDGRHMIAGNA